MPETPASGGFLIDGRPALTGIDPDEVGEYVLLTVRDPLCEYPDDPARVIAERLDGARQAGQTLMFSTWTGRYRGASVSVLSGGSGAPEAELAMHEFLAHTTATTFLRLGGSGGLHPAVRPGDLVIASGVVRDEGTTAAYVPPGWPAACAPEVTLALAQAAHTAGVRFHVGLTRSSDSDLVGTGRPGVGGYPQPWNTEAVEVYRRAGVLNTDRESSAVVTLAQLFGRRGGSICSVADNISTGEPFTVGAGHEAAIAVALDGIAVLHQMDRLAEAAGAPRWLPAIGLPEQAGDH